MSRHPADPADGSGPERPDRGWSSAAHGIDPEDPLLLDRLGIVVPDDARDLDPAAATLRTPARRHLSDLRRALARLAGPLTTVGLSALMLAAVLMSGSLVGTMGQGPGVAPPGSAPLARPTTAPGQPGGLLPDTGIQRAGLAGTAVRALRPAVLVLPPTDPDAACTGCADQLEALWRQAGEYGLRVHVVVPPDGVDLARELSATATAGRATPITDGSGALAAAYAAPRALSAVLVHSDGIVAGTLVDPAATGRYEQLLSPLRAPGAPPNLRPAPATD